MEHMTKNFHAHGGNEWVVGGKLTFLPGAVVEGIDELFDQPAGVFEPMPNQPVCEASTVAALRECVNTLLTSLKAAGLMVADVPAGNETSPSAE